jgi:2-polyprenyl-6-methoxyphenol hydroxylase-like FAD-dependent oxidoreductase
MSSQPAADAGVLIVGGGIAGLALARYLTRLGYDPTVVEQAGEWRATGYGIGLRSDGLAVLAELGRRETVRERATDPDGFEIRGADGRLLTRATLPPDRTPLLVVH